MRSVIFDVGGVLLDWNPGRVLEGYYADATERAAMKQVIFHHADWVEFDRGALSESALLERVGARAGRPVPELASLFEAIRGSLQPKADSIALLASLGARRVPLYCLSNMPAESFAYLGKRFDFWRHFHGIVISGEVRMAKPQAEIFEYLLNRYALKAADTVFVDDYPVNIGAAKALGFHTVLFQNAPQCEAALQEIVGSE
jgi:HAD superfamily hydrolase (TIGR01509 family)